MSFSWYKWLFVMILMSCEFFLIVSMVTNDKIYVVLNILAIFFSIRELCKKEDKESTNE